MKRIQRVQELLKKYRLDAFLFSSQPSVFYLSGFRSSHAYIIVTRDSHHLLTDG
ncbi:MAG: aminopeptidase P family protein, partial [Aquificota bacterium]